MSFGKMCLMLFVVSLLPRRDRWQQFVSLTIVEGHLQQHLTLNYSIDGFERRPVDHRSNIVFLI